ncbi:hypothetical protein Lal_00031471 [Lupinus albus]|nr:hypothetical protein Lal_00031471 [Lupinus albus]
MASSSRAKKQRTSVANKKQGASSSEANPFDLARLLANDEQRKVFTEHFLGRPIFAPKKEFYYSMCRFSKEEIDLRKQMVLGETVKNRHILAVGNLNLKDRLLHYFLSYVIMPKFSNHSQINDIELQLIDQNDKVYKHRSDRQAAPIDHPANVFVNPPAPQPSTFQFESYSSVQIHSNQMIMDDLFSLRGYISTRMYVLDAQNQQVQIELHRLACKINMMDLDKDSSEPKS